MYHRQSVSLQLLPIIPQGSKLTQLLQKKGFPAKDHLSVIDAVHAAIEKAKEDNHIICAFGSLYNIGKAISCLPIYEN